MHLQVDFERLRSDIEALSKIGRREDTGIYRVALSDEDMTARRWLCERIEAAGLTLHVDEAANIFGRLNWSDNAPSVMSGSHLDTVPCAGHLDGALGVVAALECLRRLKELGFRGRCPLEMASFTDEEGRFGGMLGSQAVASKLTPEIVYKAQDLKGVRFADAMAERGFDVMHALRAARPRGSIEAYVELHIEQGPVLDNEGIAIGVVTGIVGLFKWNVRLIGTSNHAGTTPMGLRRDALRGLAEFALAIDRVLEAHGGGHSVATIGRVALSPGAANVVPGQAEFTLDVRDIQKDVLETLRIAFRSELSEIARRQNLMFEFEVLSEIDPVPCDERVMSAVEAASSTILASSRRMPSGAAHDAQQLASMAPSGMIFIPSRDGRSHSPAEWSSWQAIETGANVLLRTLHALSQ